MFPATCLIQDQVGVRADLLWIVDQYLRELVMTFDASLRIQRWLVPIKVNEYLCQRTR